MELTVANRSGIEAHLKSLGWLSDDERIVSLAPAGEGNMNRTLRARLPERSLILKQAVPYVANYPHIPAPVERLEVEAAFYRIIARSVALAKRTPTVLGEDLENHLLCLEDLGEGLDFTTCYQDERPQPDAQFPALVGWLSKLHGLGISTARAPRCLENRAMRQLNHAHIFEIPFEADNGVALSPALRGFQESLAADSRLRRQAEALGHIYLGKQTHDSQDVLLHGDYYPGSWLEHPTVGIMIIDPEFAFVGAPEFDVGVFMAHLVLAGYAEGDVMELLRDYVTPPGFSHTLASAFAGMEIIRRLLGVAQLPVSPDDQARVTWLRAARAMVIP